MCTKFVFRDGRADFTKACDAQNEVRQFLFHMSLIND